MKVLRTPDERFANLPGFPFEPTYVDVKVGRMHAVDVGSGDPILCLHGEPSWSYLYRKMIPGLAKVGRVVAPDLIGFGRSDKPTAREDYTVAMHLASLEQFLDEKKLDRITLVCQDWGGLLGLPIAARQPDRFQRIVAMNTFIPTGEEKPTAGFLAWREFAERVDDLDIGRVLQGATMTELSPEVIAAYDAPFPDPSYKAGAHQFPLLVPISTEDPASATMMAARAVFQTWTKPFFALFSDCDPVTRGGDRWFRKHVPSASAEPEVTITQAGHFLQEDKGEEIADEIVRFIQRHPAR